jgi:hypothetical protein
VNKQVFSIRNHPPWFLILYFSELNNQISSGHGKSMQTTLVEQGGGLELTPD